MEQGCSEKRLGLGCLGSQGFMAGIENPLEKFKPRLVTAWRGS
jgi:hypothetical protein